MRFGPKVCEHCQPLRHETNIIVLARLNLLHRLADINLWLALASILYFATSLVLLFVTAWPVHHLVDGGVYHYIDFGSAFLFSLVEVLTLLYSPERRFSNPTLLRILIFCSVGSTFVALLFLVLNRHAFEVLAHNIDYVNDFTVALVDSLLVSTVVRAPDHEGKDVSTRGKGKMCENYGKHITALVTFLLLALSFGQIVIYNCIGVDSKGNLLGERPAHLLEFISTGIGAAINFWFCLDSKMISEALTRQIMIAPDELVVVIDPESSTGVHTAEQCGRSPHITSQYVRPDEYIRPGEPWHSHAHLHDQSCPHVRNDVCTHSHDHAVTHGHALTGQPPSTLTELLLPRDLASAL